ncbi:MAG TPA: tripartite tricarboxylate transporter substrate-binding protein [Beijerinckiaceae bacterium]
MFARILRPVLAAAALVAATGAALAQGQPIRLIFPFAAGGGGDGLARLLGEALRAELGEPVIVENRVGADGRIGVRAVAQAAPDGRTLLFTPFGPIVLHPSVYASLPYDPLKDLAPVSQVARIEFALSTGPMTGATSLKELVTWLKANPARAAYGSPGAGTVPHFSGILFATAAGVEMRHAPYRGTSPALNDLVAGQVPVASTPSSDATELHRAGKIRILATSGAQRSPFLPDVPTYKEQGYDIEGEGWYAVYATAGTPKAMVDRLSAIIVKAMSNPETKAFVEKLRLVPTGTTAEELARIQAADFERWKKPIAESGFKPTD